MRRSFSVSVLVALAMAVPAGAAPAANAATSVLSCQGRGRVSQSSPDFSVATSLHYRGGTDTVRPVGACSGDLAAATGDLDHVNFTLDGSASCVDPSGSAAGRVAGRLTLVYTNPDPATGRPYQSRAYVRLEPLGDPDLPDAVHVTGQVDRGPGAGGTLSTDMLLQPVPTADLDASGGIDVPTATSGPTLDSYLTWLDCTSGAATSGRYLRWATDGVGLLWFAGNPNAVLHSAFDLAYDQPIPSAPASPVLACAGSGRARFGPYSSIVNPAVTAMRGSTYPTASPPTACSGSASALTGPLTHVGFLLTGDALGSCGTATGRPLHGTVVLRYANIDPATGRPYSSTAYVTERPATNPFAPCSDPVEPCTSGAATFAPAELTCLVGIVGKGVGTGGDFAAKVLMHPLPATDSDGNGTIDVPTPSTPTADSLSALFDWEINAAPMPTGWMWTTSGPGYGTLFGDPTAVLDDGFVIAP
ncbi:MAG: hypothetical protein ACXV8T_05150 [Acidimicrobiia bacterium]